MPPLACSSKADSRPSSAEETWSAASCNSAARCKAVYPPPPHASSTPAANSGRVQSLAAAAPLTGVAGWRFGPLEALAATDAEYAGYLLAAFFALVGLASVMLWRRTRTR